MSQFQVGDEVYSKETEQRYGLELFFLVEVTTARLNALTALFENGKLLPHVGSVLPLTEARLAHEMLNGAPHKRGRIVLEVAA